MTYFVKKIVVEMLDIYYITIFLDLTLCYEHLIFYTTNYEHLLNW